MTIIKQAGIITCGVFAISLHAKQPGIQSTRLVEISEILLVCDTNFHGQAQVALQIAFKLLASYRHTGRNLLISTN